MSDVPALVVIGASHAGVQIAASAREFGWSGTITLVGEESEAPYQRPPLSKGFLTGKTDVSTLGLRGPSFYVDKRIDLQLGSRATAIDLAAQTVTLQDGATLPWTRLALATGARARDLAVVPAGTRGVVALRTLKDAQLLRESLHARQVVIVGAGYIGLEAAAALAEPGRSITVVEMQPRILARTTPAPVAQWLAGLHAAREVELVLSRSVKSVSTEGGAVHAVQLDDGRWLPADLLVVGIGVVANDAIARDAGLVCDDGIVVDEWAGTSHAGVTAAGDCARHVNTFAGRSLRLESIQNATDQARTAAASIVGRTLPYRSVPWFWTDQFGHKLQTVGVAGEAPISVLRGDPQTGRCSWFHFREGSLASVDSVNRPAEHMLARKLISAGVAVTPEQAADVNFDLGSLIA